MKLHDLRPPRDARKKPKRVGRGSGSGHGTTSGRGNKGLFSRSGGSLRAGFEGGQMPLMRRIPKRGFTNKFKKRYQVINIDLLNTFKEGDLVSLSTLKERNLTKKNLPIKVLGSGELKKKVKVEAYKFSKSALEKIKKAGGTTKELGA